MKRRTLKKRKSAFANHVRRLNKRLLGEHNILRQFEARAVALDELADEIEGWEP